MSELKFIPLKDITMLSNYRDVEPVNEKDPEIIELAGSITKHGVMQPILVRPNKKPGHYELIFGHRRLVAARLAKLEEIPSNVKEVADDDILEYQVTENLQRKDVHPMDEAVAFRSLMDKKNYTVDEIAVRFAKSIEFITQRLKLNDLVPELQKDFKKGMMLLGHALLFCRLTQQDQVSAKKNFSYGKEYGTVGRLNSYINENIIRNLSSAPFKKDDSDLYPEAGACKVCPKRSGANKSLFPDIDKDDRCFDGKCFDVKIAAFTAQKAKEIIETDPHIFLVCDELKEVAPVIKEMAKQMNVRILEEDKDFDDYSWSGSKFNKKAKGFYVQGYERGKVKEIYLPGKSSEIGAGSSTATKEKEKSGKLTAADITEEIKRIQEREKRSKEIDLNRVHKTTLEQLDKKAKEVMKMKHQAIDRGIMVFILLNESSGFAVHDKFSGKLKEVIKEVVSWNKKGYSEEYFTQLSKTGEFDEKHMGNVFSNTRHVHNCIAAYQSLCKGKKTLIFNCNIDHSRKVNAAFVEYGYPSRHLDSTISDHERTYILEWFKNTPDAILNNVGILTTGYDEPSILAGIINKSTMSLPLWLQMPGRLSRPYPGKEEFIIVDMGGNAMSHGDWSDPHDWEDIFFYPDKPRTGGTAPSKVCVGCGAVIHASTKTCEHCGANNQKAIIYDESTSSLEELAMRRPININVADMVNEHSRKVKKNGEPYKDISLLHSIKYKMIIHATRVWKLRRIDDRTAYWMLGIFQGKIKEWCEIKKIEYSWWHKKSSQDWFFVELKRTFDWEPTMATQRA